MSLTPRKKKTYTLNIDQYLIKEEPTVPEVSVKKEIVRNPDGTVRGIAVTNEQGTIPVYKNDKNLYRTKRGDIVSEVAPPERNSPEWFNQKSQELQTAPIPLPVGETNLQQIELSKQSKVPTDDTFGKVGRTTTVGERDKARNTPLMEKVNSGMVEGLKQMRDGIAGLYNSFSFTPDIGKAPDLTMGVLNLVSGAGNILMSPITATDQLARGIGLGTVADVVMSPFEWANKIYDGLRYGTDLAFEEIYGRKPTKTELTEKIDEIGRLGTQLLIGGKVMKSMGNTASKISGVNKTILDKAGEYIYKQTTPPNIVEWNKKIAQLEGEKLTAKSVDRIKEINNEIGELKGAIKDVEKSWLPPKLTEEQKIKETKANDLDVLYKKLEDPNLSEKELNIVKDTIANIETPVETKTNIGEIAKTDGATEIVTSKSGAKNAIDLIDTELRSLELEAKDVKTVNDLAVIEKRIGELEKSKKLWNNRLQTEVPEIKTESVTGENTKKPYQPDVDPLAGLKDLGEKTDLDIKQYAKKEEVVVEPTPPTNKGERRSSLLDSMTGDGKDAISLKRNELDKAIKEGKTVQILPDRIVNSAKTNYDISAHNLKLYKEGKINKVTPDLVDLNNRGIRNLYEETVKSEDRIIKRQRIPKEETSRTLPQTKKPVKESKGIEYEGWIYKDINELNDYLRSKNRKPETPFSLDLQKEGLTPETFWKDVQSKLEQNAGQTGIAKAYEQAKTRLSKLSSDALSAPSLIYKTGEYLKDIAIVGAYWINKGVKRVGDWTRKMTQEVGEKAVPYLKDIWDKLNPPVQLSKGSELHTMGFGKPKVEIKPETPKSLREFMLENRGKIPMKDIDFAYEKYKENFGKVVETVKTETIGKTPREPFTPVRYQDVKQRTPKTRIPMGEGKSQYEFNPNTTSKEIVDVIKDNIENNPAFKDRMKELRRNGVTDEQVMAKVIDNVGKMTDEKALKKPIGEAMPVEEHLAHVIYASKRVNEVKQNPDAPRWEVDNVLELWARQEAIGGELGRSLRGRKLIPEFKLESVKTTDLEELVNRASKDVADEIKPLIKKAKDSKDPNLWDKIRYYIYNAMLSRPVTHARNIIGGMGNFLTEGVIYNLGNPDIILKGLKNGGKNIVPKWKEIWEKGGGQGKFLEGKIYEPKNARLRNSMPTTWLKLEDAVFKELSKGIETELQAKTLAKETGVSRGDIAKGIKDFMDGKISDSPIAMEKMLQAVKEIENFADYVTFQQKMGEVGTFLSKQKWMFPIAPFIKTPINLLKVGLQPLKVVKFFDKGYREKFKEMTSTEKAKVLKRITGASMMWSALATLIGTGQIEVTGNGSNERGERSLLERTGWRPNSVKLGNKYYSFQNMNPINSFLGLMGNYMDDIKYNRRPKDDELNPVQRLSKTLAGFAQTLTEQSFLKGLSDFAKWQKTEDPYYLEQFLTMPMPGFVKRDIETYIKGDDRVFEAKTWIDKLKNKTGFTEGLREKLDIFGDPAQRSYETLPIPFSEKEDKLARLILDNDITLGFPKNDVIKANGEKITEDEYYEYHKQSGQAIKKILEENYDKIRTLPPDELNREVRNVVNKTREDVRENLFGKKENSKGKYKYKIDTKDSKTDNSGMPKIDFGDKEEILTMPKINFN